MKLDVPVKSILKAQATMSINFCLKFERSGRVREPNPGAPLRFGNKKAKPKPRPTLSFRTALQNGEKSGVDSEA
jgi:hypothetical protein